MQMTRLAGSFLLLILLVLGVGHHPPSQAETKNHSMRITFARMCLDGADLRAFATSISALDEEFTINVWDTDFNGPLYTGDSHTFTELSDPYLFTVLYSGPEVGETYILAITNDPGEIVGSEGTSIYVTVQDCMLPVELKSFSVE